MKYATPWAVLVIAVAGFVAPAVATPYFIDWEGDNWPEAVGYERNWGDLQGQYHGSGAVRTLEDGVLTYDSLYDPGVCDAYYMERPGQMDPDLGQLFVAEWRLKVDLVHGAGDPAVGFYGDDAWGLGYVYTEDHIRSVFEGYLNIPFAPYVWHDYRIVSSDMRAYDLFIDNVLVRHGAFVHVVTSSYAGFGDASQSASSLHHWDFFRFGVVVPEPSALLLLLWVTAWRGARRG
jgi:hypothetical protein